LREKQFAATRNLLTNAVIIKHPCQEADPEIRAYLNHTATSATSNEWPVQIPPNTHMAIPYQNHWLHYLNPICHYFEGVYPHSFELMPRTTFYGYLHKITFLSTLATPITQFIFDTYGPSAVQSDTIALRDLTHFAHQRIPVWVYHTFQPRQLIDPTTGTLSSNAYMRITKRILWKEQSLEERLEEALHGIHDNSDDESMTDWEAHSPRSHHY
jgi:hypothetical protein